PAPRAAPPPAPPGRPRRRTDTAGFNHQQPGDPVKGAAVIVHAIDGGAFPVRLLPGPDAISVVTEKIDQVRAELARQHGVAVYGRPGVEGRGGVLTCVCPMQQWRPPAWGSCKP
ncbi:hypothetical protein ACFWDX_52880, partial [Streptomyces mirabilis]